jgi:hypothetical protein
MTAKNKTKSREPSTLQDLKDEFVQENVKEFEAIVNAVKTEGDPEEKVRYIDESMDHSKKAVQLLAKIETQENIESS